GRWTRDRPMRSTIRASGQLLSYPRQTTLKLLTRRRIAASREAARSRFPLSAAHTSFSTFAIESLVHLLQRSFSTFVTKSTICYRGPSVPL
ncbi:unnamed protein product, partial [Trichogramma brassicae]